MLAGWLAGWQAGRQATGGDNLTTRGEEPVFHGGLSRKLRAEVRRTEGMSHGCASLFPLSPSVAPRSRRRGKEGRPRTRMRLNCRLQRKTRRKVATETRISRREIPRLRAATLSRGQDKMRSCREQGQELAREARGKKSES